MKKIKTIGVYVIFILSFLSHFMYDIFPNPLFSILFPVNESIWEHMKLLVTPVIIYSLIEYFIYKKKNIPYNNFILSYAISFIVSIIVYLIIYLPVHLIFGHNLLFSIYLLFIIFILIEVISYKIMNYKEIKYTNIIGFGMIILIYIIFWYLTYYPFENMLFYDTTSNSYGIKK